ncbi:PTS sugar transporter subunit IIC [Lactobacillus crispatus]|uniref:PTS sugar transporter subunit IIC n=1 Tax=Lactobacillus crispatus TaxID=47770 RepID=UPI0007736458|nr:PTS transporter subunit EIIC [Lactobacillus crispatus]
MKDKITNFFQKLQPKFAKVGNNKYLQAIMGAMMATLGPMILGSMATLISVYANQWHWTKVATICGNVNVVTIGCIAIYVAFLMGKNVASQFLNDDDGMAAGIISLMSFLIITPLGKIKTGAFIPSTWLGASGLFSAMIVGIIAGRAYVYMKEHHWTIKMPAGVPPMVSNVFASLIPSLIIGTFFVLVALVFTLTPFGSFHQMIYTFIQVPLKNIGGSLWAMIFICFLEQLVWFFGIHGTNVIIPIVMPIWMSMDMQNLSAYQAGKPLPNMIGYAFFNVVTWSGTALGLILLMVFFAKSKRYKTLGKLALVPGLFGITEPVIFGTPLVLNFDFFVPFVFNNAIFVAVAALLTKIGVVARFCGAQSVFGLPIGIIASCGGSVSIIIMQLVLQLVLSPLLWYPWFKRADRKALTQEQQSVEA